MNEDQRKYVAKCRERANKASKGPWIKWRGHAQVMHGPAEENKPWIFRHAEKATHGTIAECRDDDAPRGQATRNAKFIAHARNDVPKLCDIIDEQDAELTLLRAKLADLDPNGSRG